jgi:hypothetical protein
MHRILVGDVPESTKTHIRMLDVIRDIPKVRPDPPAGASRWPPDKDTRIWLNVVLDIEMNAEVDAHFNEIDLSAWSTWFAVIKGATPAFVPEELNELPKISQAKPNEVRELLAIGRAYHGQGDGSLLELLRDPAATLSMMVRGYIARRIEGRPPGAPKRTRRAGTVTWRAERDAKRLRQLLREVCPKAPRRGSRYAPSVAGIANEIAAARWGISVGTLVESMARPKNDRRRLAPPETKVV